MQEPVYIKIHNQLKKDIENKKYARNKFLVEYPNLNKGKYTVFGIFKFGVILSDFIDF